MILEEPQTVSVLFGYFRNYTDGFLPFAGAISDQPHVLVEALQEISLVKGILDQEDAEAAKDGNETTETGGFKSIVGKRRGK